MNQPLNLLFQLLRHMNQPLNLVHGDIVQSNNVLNGFQFRVSDLFRQPSTDELLEDAIYYDFVVPAYKALKQQVEAAEKMTEMARQRAEEAEKMADMERQRAERLAEQLRSLGVSVD